MKVYATITRVLIFRYVVGIVYCCSHAWDLKIARNTHDMSFGLGRIAFSLIQLTPETTNRRKTILTEVVKERVWTLDQLQGLFNVNVPVRSVVIRLRNGGLFVNNPVAPTRECLNMIHSIEQVHGAVKYIVLSSVAVEHKGTAGAFCRAFPTAEIFVQPGQYSFPVNLATAMFFPVGRRVRVMPATTEAAPWADDLEQVTLGPLKSKGAGSFSETAFLHRDTSTLLVTDVVLQVPDTAPAIVLDNPRALLYHARDRMLEEVADTEDTRRKGWRRMALFALVFQPAGIRVNSFADTIRKLSMLSPEMAALGRGAVPFSEGLYPWDWVNSEEASFRALQAPLLVAPVLSQLILNREPERVMQFVASVCRWPFRRVVPAHFANDVRATPADFRRAFDFLLERPPAHAAHGPFFFPRKMMLGEMHAPPPLVDDLQLLRRASGELTKLGVIKPPAPLLKRTN